MAGAPEEQMSEFRRRLVGFPGRAAVARDDSYLHVGRRSFSRRVRTADGVAVKKTFVRMKEAREAFRVERRAMERLRGSSWFPQWRASGSRWYLRDYFEDETRLDRVVAAADDDAKRRIAAGVAAVVLDLYCRGVAHRDLHAKNAFADDEGVHVVDFETCLEFPADYQPSLSAFYDVTGEGLPSPYHTAHMGFDNTANAASFRNVLSMPFAAAFRHFIDGVEPERVKDQIRAACAAFATKEGGRHKCKAGRIYGSFSLPRTTVTAAEAQRDSARRFVRFGLTEADLRGKSLLDLGSNIGGMLFEAQRFGPARSVGVEYDPDKVAVSRRVAAINELADVAFVNADIDALSSSAVRGPFDVVFCLAVEAHVNDKRRLYELLAEATTGLLLFEGNDTTDAKAAADELRRAGFREVESLGNCDDDCRPENNVRPLLRATK